jgi:hypothetical protein
VTPKDTSLLQTTSFELSGVVVGRLVRVERVFNESKNEKGKTGKAATSPYWGDEILEATAMNFGTSNDLRTFIECVKSGFDR